MTDTDRIFEFAGSCYRLTPDGLGAQRLNKTRGTWEKRVHILTDWNLEFQAAAATARREDR